MPWKNGSSERVGIALAILAALGFSLKAIFVKLAYSVAPVEAITLLALRMALSLPFFIVAGFVALRSGAPISRRDWGLLVVLGLLGYYASSLFDFLGLQYISAGLERLILFTYPTLTIVVGVLFLGKRFDRHLIPALLLSYAGIGLAFAHDVQLAGDPRTVLIGAGFVFASALTYACYSAGAEVAVHRMGSVRFSALGLLVSTMAAQIHFLLSEPLSALIQPWPVYAYGAAMALFSTVLPVFWQSAAIRRIGSARTVLIGTLGPMLTLFFSWTLLDEPLSFYQLGGMALVVAGVWQISRRS